MNDDPVQLDQDAPAQARSDARKRALETEAELYRQKQRQMSDKLLRRQNILGEGEPISIRILRIASILLGLLSVFSARHVIRAGGAKAYFQAVNFLGFIIRPSFLLSLSAATCAAAYFLLRLIEHRRRQRALQIETSWVLELALKAASMLYWVFFTGTALSALGWEAALTYLKGYQASLIATVVTGLALRWIAERLLAPPAD